jgi:uncharacterized pyridoxal phosphate-containing UPF0001 family protein
MVSIPADLIISTTLKVGAIYKLTAPELINTKIPHYFIIVGIDDEDNYMVLCTSQKENKLNHFKNNNLELEGLVCIQPNKVNKLKKETFVNCNDYHTISKSKLKDKINSDSLEVKGEISLNIYTQIKNGIIKSEVNDLPEFLLIHPDE